MARFFVDKEKKQDNKIIIDGEENQHLCSVLRMREGDMIEVCFNDGYVNVCKLLEVGKKSSIALIEKSYMQSQSLSKITLFLALIKSERLDWAVQKCTELGIDEIVTFDSEYCTVKDKGNKEDRLRRVAVSACKQSGRATIPQISCGLNFNEMLDKLKDFSQVVVAYENDKTSAKQVLSKLDKNKNTAIIIGSEGGFSQKEIDDLLKNGAKVVSLGNTILRAETACVALLSALNYEFDNWKRK